MHFYAGLDSSELSSPDIPSGIEHSWQPGDGRTKVSQLEEFQ
jgi:hypothetical protein